VNVVGRIAVRAKPKPDNNIPSVHLKKKKKKKRKRTNGEGNEVPSYAVQPRFCTT